LCLPDAAAREAVSLVTNPKTILIDASTAHRTDPAWAYGLPELGADYRERIRTSNRIAVNGCHACAFLLGVRPLVAAGLVPADHRLSCFSITGYSGGGKKLIATYEQNPAPNLTSPRSYALGMSHKHLPEMTVHAGLAHSPTFVPVVGAFYKGLAVTVPLSLHGLPGRPRLGDVYSVFADVYAHERFVRVLPLGAESNLDGGFFDVQACNDTNRADILVTGNDEHAAVIVRIDNLGKGASGSAVQCMNLRLGLDEGAGLSA
ncbi:MAG: N-acetyl-gamma-glutamyl-phosphate reductase, partial [Verrucomicrobia bacterium]